MGGKSVHNIVAVVDWENVFVSIESSLLLIAKVFVFRYESDKSVFVVDYFVLEEIPVDGELLLFASLSKPSVDQSK